jgi:DNA-binding MarR family transcriptional regulator
MELVGEVVSGIVSGVLATAVVAVAAAIWRWRLLRKYNLTNAARQVLEALWDENLLRRSAQIAAELGLGEAVVLEALEELQVKKLARERNRPNGKFWKITLKGKEYLRQRSWID